MHFELISEENKRENLDELSTAGNWDNGKEDA